MRNIPLLAIRRCGRYGPGEEFMGNHVEAKALVFIGHAQYLTRDMTAQRA